MKTFAVPLVVVLTAMAFASRSGATPISVYGAWHCGSDFCTWGSVRDVYYNSEFDQKNRWLIDRNRDLTYKPSVNLVVLSFVHPLRLLNQTNDAQTVNGIPKGMTRDVVNYFKERGIRVMLSIGGITYVDAWNQALATNDSAWQLGLRAASVASDLGVGIEIDYEENRSPRLDQLQKFIEAYRSIHPYDPGIPDDPSDATRNPAARLTIDLAAGDRWLIALTRKATADWLNPNSDPLRRLDYANAMVPSRQPNSASDAIANWQEHIDGKSQYSPPIPSLAPAKFTGSLYIVTGSKPARECVDFSASLQKSTGTFIQNVAPKSGVGSTNGMLGYMFWAAECQGTRSICTTPPNSCEGGVGLGAATYNVPIPMRALRQE